MDKYELVLDIIEHPEKYSLEQLSEIFSDVEVKEIYNLLSKTVSAVEANREVNVDAEWADFSKRNKAATRRYFIWFGSRAASIAAIVFTSMVAVAASIAIFSNLRHYRAVPEHEIETSQQTTVGIQDSIVVYATEVHQSDLKPVLFENEPLEKIMSSIVAIYNVEIKFNDSEVSSLRLYYKLNPALSIDEVVSQLNTFERINIKRNGNTLIID